MVWLAGAAYTAYCRHAHCCNVLKPQLALPLQLPLTQLERCARIFGSVRSLGKNVIKGPSCA
jgi:hypothetical protein